MLIDRAGTLRPLLTPRIWGWEERQHQIGYGARLSLLIIHCQFCYPTFPMNLLCRLFGHRPAFGYCEAEGEGYFRITNIMVDQIGTHHASLYCECERCKVNYKVGNVHIPSRYTDKTTH